MRKLISDRLNNIFLLLFFVSFLSNAQIENFTKDAWSFEIDTVKWSENMIRIYPKPKDIVEAWSAEFGFTRSNEFAHHGKYSLKVDYKTLPVPNNPKLQTTRFEHKRKIGNFDIVAPGEYTVSMWVYLVGKPSGVMRVVVAKSINWICTADFDFSKIAPNKWTRFSQDFVVTEENVKKGWYGVFMFQTFPEDCIIYVDEVIVSDKKQALAESSIASPVKTNSADLTKTETKTRKK